MSILEQSNDFLNADIDTLEFAPDFINPQTDNYLVTTTKCEIGTRERAVKGSASGETEEVLTLDLHCRVDQVLNESVSPDGIVGNVIGYTFWDKAGITNGFNKPFREISEQLGLKTTQDLIQYLSNGVQLEITHKQTKNKNDPDRPYSNLSAVALV